MCVCCVTQDLPAMPILEMLNSSSEGVKTTREGVLVLTDVAVTETQAGGASARYVQTLAGAGDMFLVTPEGSADTTTSFSLSLVGGDASEHVLHTTSQFDCIACVNQLNIPVHQGTMADFVRKNSYRQSCSVDFNPYQLYSGPQQVLTFVFETLLLRSAGTSITLYDIRNEILVATLQGPVNSTNLSIQALAPVRMSFVFAPSWRDAANPYLTELQRTFAYKVTWTTRRGVPTNFEGSNVVWGHKDCIDRCPPQDKAACYQHCLQLRRSALFETDGAHHEGGAAMDAQSRLHVGSGANSSASGGYVHRHVRANNGKETPMEEGVKHLVLAASAQRNRRDICDFGQRINTLLLAMQRVEGEALLPLQGTWQGTCRSSTLCPANAVCEKEGDASYPYTSGKCQVAIYVNGSTLIKHVWGCPHTP